MSVPYLTVEQLTEHSLNLSRERDRYKQAAEEMAKKGQQMINALEHQVNHSPIVIDAYAELRLSLAIYSKLKEELK